MNTTVNCMHILKKKPHIALEMNKKQGEERTRSVSFCVPLFSFEEKSC